MATPEQTDRIIELYHQGATFQRAIDRIPEQSPNRESQVNFYEGYAEAGQLSQEQASSLFNQCDPAGKGKVSCEYVLDQIAEDESVSPEEVRTVLRNHFAA